jgi:hypothetical protein
MSAKKRDIVLLERDDAAHEKKSQSTASAHDEAFQSDDEMPDESSEERLRWGTTENKENSFSDWKIAIGVATLCNRENDKNSCMNGNECVGSTSISKECTTYHVHKAIMATGPRRCEYFIRLFEHKQRALSDSHESTTSRMELPELCAQAFPEFLDYVYMAAENKKGGGGCCFTTGNATALYSLAKYFDVRRLRHEVKKFILQDCRQSETCGTYYEHAKILDEHVILEALTSYWRDHSAFLQQDSRLLDVTDAQFWLDLMEYQLPKIRGSSTKHFSILIAAFCRIHRLSPEEFNALTSERYLECIDPKAAVQLLYLESKLLVDNDMNNNSRDDGELSNLQQRCVKSIARFHDDDDCQSSLDGGDILKDVPPNVLRQVIFGNTIQNLPPLVLRDMMFGKVTRRCDAQF